MDGSTAVELMRSAAALGGEGTDTVLFKTATRLSSRTSRALAEILGRRWASKDKSFTWPPAIESDVSESGPSDERGTPEGRATLSGVAAAASQERDANLLLTALGVAEETGTDIDPTALRTAVRTSGRESVCWYLAKVGPTRLPAELIEEATTVPVDGNFPFGCEILARIVGRALESPPIRDWTSERGQDELKRVPFKEALIRYLSSAEKKALSQAVFGQPDLLDESNDSQERSRRPRPPGGPRQVDADAPESVSLLDLSAFPKGYVEDVIAVTGCRKVTPKDWGGAEIRYKGDGRPFQVTLFKWSQDLGSCQAAARLLFMTTLAPRSTPIRPGRVHVLFIRLDPGTLACALPSDPPPEPFAIYGRFTEPKKTNSVKPKYLDSALAEGAEGKVILEALITTSGCVANVSVLQTAHPALDIAALRAVADWRYSPALLGGKPVPVILNVTVDFNIR
jgi:TonB family protein